MSIQDQLPLITFTIIGGLIVAWHPYETWLTSAIAAGAGLLASGLAQTLVSQ